MKTALIVLALVGWASSVAGAALIYSGAARFDDVGDGTIKFDQEPGRSRVGLMMTMAGATLGLAGTILAFFA